MLHPDHLRNDTLVESMLRMIERMTPQTHEAQIRALLNRPEAGDVLPTIRCPTLVLCGRQDNWSPVARHEELARLISGSRLEIIEDSGHMTPMEQPARVSAALLDWLQQIA
jgi:pimeloyl-ACP methyl ester carboxylesterase